MGQAIGNMMASSSLDLNHEYNKNVSILICVVLFYAYILDSKHGCAKHSQATIETCLQILERIEKEKKLDKKRNSHLNLIRIFMCQTS